MKKRGEGRRVGRIENWQPLTGEKEHKKKEKRKEETKKSRKYVHEILGGESDELRSVKVEKEAESSEGEEEGKGEVYRAVQGGAQIPPPPPSPPPPSPSPSPSPLPGCARWG